MSSWLSGEGEEYADVREAVREGRVMWVSVLEFDYRGARPDMDTVEDWATEFDNRNVVVLRGGETPDVFVAIGLGATPTSFVVDARTMRIEHKGYTIGDVQDVLAELLAQP